jgi:hypothetical protein
VAQAFAVFGGDEAFRREYAGSADRSLSLSLEAPRMATRTALRAPNRLVLSTWRRQHRLALTSSGRSPPALPPGETSGSLTFPIQPLGTVAGRPMLGGLKLLLDRSSLFSAARQSGQEAGYTIFGCPEKGCAASDIILIGALVAAISKAADGRLWGIGVGWIILKSG